MTAKKRTLFLHAGLPKTGTSALQKYFYQNRSLLKDRKIDYPDPLDPVARKHGFITPELRGTMPSNYLKEILERPTRNSLLISNEGLSNHFHDFPASSLQRFRALTTDFNVVIILTTRDEKSWLKSYHKQCVLNPNIDASDLWGTALKIEDVRDHYRVRRLLDTKTLLRDMKESFGAQHIHHINYDDPAWSNNILKLIGLGDLPSPILPRTNSSLPDWSIEWLRQINGLYEDQNDRAVWKHLLGAFLDVNNSELRRSTDRLRHQGQGRIDLSLLEKMRGALPEALENLKPAQEQEINAFAHFVTSSAPDGLVTL